jgi:hypothetical protein
VALQSQLRSVGNCSRRRSMALAPAPRPTEVSAPPQAGAGRRKIRRRQRGILREHEAMPDRPGFTAGVGQ